MICCKLLKKIPVLAVPFSAVLFVNYVALSYAHAKSTNQPVTKAVHISSIRTSPHKLASRTKTQTIFGKLQKKSSQKFRDKIRKVLTKVKGNFCYQAFGTFSRDFRIILKRFRNISGNIQKRFFTTFIKNNMLGKLSRIFPKKSVSACNKCFNSQVARICKPSPRQAQTE